MAGEMNMTISNTRNEVTTSVEAWDTTQRSPKPSGSIRFDGTNRTLPQQNGMSSIAGFVVGWIALFAKVQSTNEPTGLNPLSRWLLGCQGLATLGHVIPTRETSKSVGKRKLNPYTPKLYMRDLAQCGRPAWMMPKAVTTA